MPSLKDSLQRHALLSKLYLFFRPKKPAPLLPSYASQPPLGTKQELKHLRSLSQSVSQRITALKDLKRELWRKEKKARKAFIACKDAGSVQLIPPYKGSRLNPNFKEKEIVSTEQATTLAKWTELRLAIRERSRVKEEIREKKKKLDFLQEVLEFRRAERRVGYGNVDPEELLVMLLGIWVLGGLVMMMLA